MNKFTKVSLSAALNAAITFLTALSASYATLETGATLGDITAGPILAALIGALITGLKDVQAYLTQPPA